jgi:hypothetical protein
MLKEIADQFEQRSQGMLRYLRHRVGSPCDRARWEGEHHAWREAAEILRKAELVDSHHM